MPVRILRRTSGVLVLLFLTLAGADALCAMPCGMPGATPQPGATADSHCKTLSNDSLDDTAISSSGDSCGVEHGRLGLAAESASSRSSLVSATAPSTPIHFSQDLWARGAVTIAPHLNASDGSPQVTLPLRI